MKTTGTSIKALTFDIFGTVVDWRSTIIEEATRFGRKKGIAADWAGFADAWRSGYKPAMDRVRRGELPWMNLDALHRMILDHLLDEFEIARITEADRKRINRVWHYLKAWPDSASGLERLRKCFLVAALSNGNMALLTNLSKNAGLSWDCILSAELARHYKPDKEVYLMAANLLGLRPDQIMMVAAHEDDLLGAKRCGLRTALVPRPLEYGPDSRPHQGPDHDFDIVASDFHDLAEKLEA
jgi:2-haloacid dehalogenase